MLGDCVMDVRVVVGVVVGCGFRWMNNRRAKMAVCARARTQSAGAKEGRNGLGH